MVQFIREQQLDAAVAVTRVNFGTNDAGVIRAAQAVGVPVGLVVWSWDNLTSKGLIHERPDKLFVWNDLQAREAADLHGIDPATIEVTGAPRFDAFWARKESASRDGLLGSGVSTPARRRRSTSARRSSSSRTSGRSSRSGWRRCGRAATRCSSDANVLVRPHPSLVDVWAEWAPEDRRVSMPPSRRQGPAAVGPDLRLRRRRRAEHQRGARGGDRRPSRS